MRYTLTVALLLATAPAAAQTITGATTRATRGHDARVVATVAIPAGTDAIVGGSSPVAAAVMAHTVRGSTIEPGAPMAPASIPLAAGHPRRLSVHGYHIMLMGLRRPLVAGDRVPLTVRLRSGAAIATTVEVVK